MELSIVSELSQLSSSEDFSSIVDSSVSELSSMDSEDSVVFSVGSFSEISFSSIFLNTG